MLRSGRCHPTGETENPTNGLFRVRQRAKNLIIYLTNAKRSLTNVKCRWAPSPFAHCKMLLEPSFRRETDAGAFKQ
jgi:hypothetical protein